MDRALAIEIDPGRPEPAYQQIAAGIREHIASGALAPGASLPGVRRLAADLGVNINTVARAYRVLEEQGFVRIRDRSGVEVAVPKRRADPDERASLERELTALLARMRQAGVTPGQLRRVVGREIDALAGTGPESES
jgi:DNA-binding transcriptional regulator YhcF (GntR family)